MIRDLEDSFIGTGTKITNNRIDYKITTIDHVNCVKDAKKKKS